MGIRFCAIALPVLLMATEGASTRTEADVAPMPPASPRVHAIARAEESDAERNIRTQLAQAIATDSLLRGERITVRVSGNDILLDGRVKTEAQRRHTTDIAMALPSVRSVSNGLRITD